MSFKQLLIPILLILAACQPQDTLDSTQVDFKQVDFNRVDFHKVNWYAKRAAMAYQTEAEIRQAFQDTVLVATTLKSDVLYFLDSVHGAYEHLGPEVMLLTGKYYAFQTHHQVERFKDDSFWNNLGDESISAHFMKHYLQNIDSKLTLAVSVPYDQREHYILN